MNNEQLDAKIACPYPFPPAEQVTGFYAFGDDVWLPAQCGISMNELEDEPDRFDGGILLKIIRLEDGSFATAEESITMLLDALNLPALDRLDLDDGVREYLDDCVQQRSHECDTGFETGRKQFEELYKLVAASDYVQLFESTQIVYIVNQLPGLDLAQAEEVYRRFYPAIHNREALAAPEELELRVLVNRRQEVLGYSERDLECFMGADFMKTNYAKHGVLVMGWGDWSGNTRSHGQRGRRR